MHGIHSLWECGVILQSRQRRRRRRRRSRRHAHHYHRVVIVCSNSRTTSVVIIVITGIIKIYIITIVVIVSKVVLICKRLNWLVTIICKCNWIDSIIVTGDVVIVVSLHVHLHNRVIHIVIMDDCWSCICIKCIITIIYHGVSVSRVVVIITIIKASIKVVPLSGIVIIVIELSHLTS